LLKHLLLETQSSHSEIFIGAGILASQLVPLCKQLTSHKKIAVVTDSTVYSLYGETLMQILRDGGFSPVIMSFSAGEASKHLGTVSEIYTFLSEHNFSRTDPIIALGGGVVGDIVGFAAATYLRGIHSIQIPTTLLAQVDSSVGGKCGVDLPCGKNLVGAFNQPDFVLIDTDLLSTLPEDIFADGMAEVIKYGCLFDHDLFSLLESSSAHEHITEIVARCVAHKRDIVVQDEHDLGARMLLNFGHTIGHAIEVCGNFTLHTHGQSVARGMIAACKIGEKLGITNETCLPRLLRLLNQYQLGFDLPYSQDEIATVLFKDKKFLSGELNFIIIEEIGKGTLHPLTKEEVFEVLPAIY